MRVPIKRLAYKIAFLRGLRSVCVPFSFRTSITFLDRQVELAPLRPSPTVATMANEDRPLIASIKVVLTAQQTAALRQSRLFTDRCKHQSHTSSCPLMITTCTGYHQLIVWQTLHGCVFQFVRRSGSRDYQFTLEVLRTLLGVLGQQGLWLELHGWSKRLFLADGAKIEQGLLALQRQRFRQTDGEKPTLTPDEARAVARLLTDAFFAGRKERRQLYRQWHQQTSRYIADQ